MKKILIFVTNFAVGGVTSLIQDIYRNLDRSKYEIAFVSQDGNRSSFDEEIIDAGDKIYYIKNEQLNNIPVINYTIRKKHMIKKVCTAVGKDKYDVAYIHANAMYAVPAAKRLGIPKIIMHVHEALSDFNGNENKSKIIRLIWNDRVKMYNRLVDHKLGDSKRACIAKFGEGVVDDKAMMVVNPPINMQKFNPEAYNSQEIDKEFNISKDSFNMIHVGRLSGVKNQKFLIDILKEMKEKRKAALYIVGDGDAVKKMLMEHAQKLGVLENVHFLAGNTTPGIYKLMQCSILPSFSEAFGMVAVESQLMGVPCFVSENVPEDVDAGMCSFIELGKGAKFWAEKILEYDYKNAALDGEKARNFDINYTLKKLEEIF